VLNGGLWLVVWVMDCFGRFYYLILLFEEFFIFDPQW